MTLQRKLFEYVTRPVTSLFKNANRMNINFLERLRPVYKVPLGSKQLQFYCPNEMSLWRAKTLLTKEPDTIAWINSFAPHSIFYDIGANVGLYSLYAATKECTVYAFEPESQNYAALNYNIHLNQFSEIINAYNIAISDETKLGHLFIKEFTIGGALNNFDECVNYKKEKFTPGFKQAVSAFKLDDLIASQQLPMPHHLKIDVDGLESAIIAGATQVLNHPTLKSVLIELNTSLAIDNAIIEVMTGFGFKLASRFRSPIYDQSDFKDIYNHIFVRESRARPHPFKPLQSHPPLTLTRPSREVSEERSAQVLWLDKNENCDPQYLEQIQTLMHNLPQEALYGYPDCYALYKKLAHKLNKKINQLFLAAGSDGIIRAVHDAFVEAGDTVVYTDPTFAMYPLYAAMRRAKAHVLHYEPSPNGPRLTMQTVVDAIKHTQPRLISLPIPNSPSGTVFTPEELIAIINTAKSVQAYILIDEAYYPFYEHTTAEWINEFPNLIVARTFSKAYGLAGIRIGYGIGCETLMMELHKRRPMYEAGALSVILAERILEHEAEMLASVKRLNAGKAYFLQAMQQLGFRTFPTYGNFLHVAFADKAQAIHQALANKVLYRQRFNHSSLADYSRFTATTEAKFAPIIEIIESVCKQGA